MTWGNTTATARAAVNVSQHTKNEWEESISVDPSNPQRLFVASNQDSESTGLFTARSSDGGATWTTRFMADGKDGLADQACCDPSVAFDNFGNLFVDYINNTVNKAVIALSTDGGATFKELMTFTADDQPKLAVGANTVWMVWHNTDSSGKGQLQASGASITGLGSVGAFSSVQTVPNIPTGVDPNFGKIAIGPKGEVMVSFQNSGSREGPDTIYSSVDADGLGAGGFANPVKVSDTNVGGFDHITPQPLRSVDANSGPAYDRSGGQFNGRAFMVYTQESAVGSNQMSILVRTSDDNGKTWSAPVQVNDDASTSAKFFPRIAVDQTTGNLAVSWYDARLDTGSGPHDTDGKPNTDVEFFCAVSVDGGQSFSPNLDVAAGPSNVLSNPNNGNDYGDYTGLDFFGGVFYPCWADNSAQLQPPNPDRPNLDVAVAAVTVSQVLSGGGVTLPEDVFEPNETSDTATQFGILTGTQTYANLTIATHANGLPDYDWYRWTAGTAGTFTATVSPHSDSGNLELHLFTLSGNTLVELGNTTVGPTGSGALAASVFPGQALLVEVKGQEVALGVFAQGTYDLAVSL